MPFDFKKFDVKCSSMSIDELQREWDHYTRLISGSATSTAVSGAAIPFTLGVSVIGVGLAAPAIHNARKKREIIERHLQRLGTTHHTRKRDVLTPMAISGTVGLVTLGVGSAGAGAITNAAMEHGITSVAANEIAVKATVHLAVDGVAMAGEEHHMKQKRLAEAHNAWLKGQQEKAGDVGKVEQPAVSPYITDTFIQQLQTTTNTGYPVDIKYEYSPVPVSSQVPEPGLPPYSPPSYDGHQNYFPLEKFSDKPGFDNATTYYPPTPQNYDAKAPYYDSPSVLIQTRPQPQPIQTPAMSVSTPESSTGQSNYQTPNQYQYAPTQPTPQMMYPSYPTSIIPDSAHQQYGQLSQVMSELSISAVPPPPPTQANSPSRAPTPKPPAPTSRGYCSQPQQTSEQNTSYFTQPSPITPASTVNYQQSTDTSCLSPPVTQHATFATPSRSTSISSVSSYQTYSSGQTQATSFNQYGYMTPVPTPGSQYDPSSAQRHGSISSQSQRHSSVSSQHEIQYPPPPPAPTPVSTQPTYNYASRYPTPAQTPYYSQPPTPQNHSQYSHPQQQQQSYCQPQPSYPQPPAQSPNQNQSNWQPWQTQSTNYGPPYANQSIGYPTPTATPSYFGEQQKQTMYFPPPPTQPVK